MIGSGVPTDTEPGIVIHRILLGSAIGPPHFTMGMSHLLLKGFGKLSRNVYM